MGQPRNRRRGASASDAPPEGFSVGQGLTAALPAPGPASPGAGLAKRERLCGRARIDALFAGGAVGASKLVMARALPSPYPLTRAAFLVGKAFGGAVKRGRLKRRLRTIFREHKRAFAAPPAIAVDGWTAQGWDVAILPRRGADAADAEALKKDVLTALHRAFAAATARLDAKPDD